MPIPECILFVEFVICGFGWITSAFFKGKFVAPMEAVGKAMHHKAM
jgi:hypothetical protein